MTFIKEELLQLHEHIFLPGYREISSDRVEAVTLSVVCCRCCNLYCGLEIIWHCEVFSRIIRPADRNPELARNVLQ